MRKGARVQGEIAQKRENFLFISSIPTIHAIPANPRSQRALQPAIPSGDRAVCDFCGDGCPTNEVDGKGCFGSDTPFFVRGA